MPKIEFFLIAKKKETIRSNWNDWELEAEVREGSPNGAGSLGLAAAERALPHWQAQSRTMQSRRSEMQASSSADIIMTPANFLF